MVFDPRSTYVRLSTGGAAESFPGGEAFWRLSPVEMGQTAAGWMIAEFAFDRDWPNWEMHPHADEFVYLLSGHVTLLLEMPHGIERVELRGRGAVLVPRAVWHTALVHQASAMLHVTLGKETEQRPAP
jgi:mannose-6-phosphate isomerase-like protein (cupin superfamily)